MPSTLSLIKRHPNSYPTNSRYWVTVPIQLTTPLEKKQFQLFYLLHYNKLRNINDQWTRIISRHKAIHLSQNAFCQERGSGTCDSSFILNLYVTGAPRETLAVRSGTREAPSFSHPNRRIKRRHHKIVESKFMSCLRTNSRLRNSLINKRYARHSVKLLKIE